MRKSILLLLVSLFLFLNEIYAQTADVSASQDAKCVLQYISSLSSQSSQKLISGQWMNYRGLPETPTTEFDTAITSLYNKTNSWIGLIGTNYTRYHTYPYYIAIENMYQVNQPLINYYKKNGLVVVMANFKNPWNQTNSNDTTKSSNLLEVITTGNAANTNFNKELDSLAKGFSQLQDSGVVVMFRPFHEMNGNWFWWGSKNSTLPLTSDYVELWKYVFNYLTVKNNLHNILWVYAPCAKETANKNPNFKTEMFYYPGSNYVDIIGLDIYNDTLDIPNYQAILAAKKPLGLAEFGPAKSTVLNLTQVYDYTILLSQIKNKYPAICFWVSWNHFKNSSNDWIYYSLDKQKNVSNLLADSWVVNRDKINYSNCLVTSDEEIFQDELNLYPNPSNSNFHFQGLQNWKTIEIFEVSGKIVLTQNIIDANTTIDMSNFSEGIYFFNVINSQEKYCGKLILKKQ